VGGEVGGGGGGGGRGGVVRGGARGWHRTWTMGGDQPMWPVWVVELFDEGYASHTTFLNARLTKHTSETYILSNVKSPLFLYKKHIKYKT